MVFQRERYRKVFIIIISGLLPDTTVGERRAASCFWKYRMVIIYYRYYFTPKQLNAIFIKGTDSIMSVSYSILNPLALKVIDSLLWL